MRPRTDGADFKVCGFRYWLQCLAAQAAFKESAWVLIRTSYEEHFLLRTRRSYAMSFFGKEFLPAQTPKFSVA